MKTKVLLYYIFAFGCGCVFGHCIHTKRLNDKVEYLNFLYNLIKKRNNDFLSNFSELYSLQSNSEGKYTDMDEYIQSMWMD